MAKVKITETVLRDAHQSLFATRMRTEEMLPALEDMDRVGYHAIEMWGGATFDVCMRFLNEDPWERLKTIRSHIRHTKLQMLLRGQNLLGYRQYADDVVDAFVQKSVDNGIDIIRIIDAVNDTRNVRRALEATKRAGAHAQAAMSYTKSPVHTNELYVKLAKTYEEMGADSICIKDMSGISDPMSAYSLVRALKQAVRIPIEYHTHMTCGLGTMVYLMAVQAGADIIDTAISPLAGGTSQPATETMVATLQGTEYDTGLRMEQFLPIAAHFEKVREKYLANGMINSKVLEVNVDTLLSQIPGGMMSNLISQLQAQNAMDRFDEVLREVPRVRAEIGYPPLVTPTSQICATQALYNVLAGERYKVVSTEMKKLLLGMYGKLAAKPDAVLMKRVLGDEKPIDCRPADLLEPELDKIRQQYQGQLQTEEDLLSAAMFPQIAEEFFRSRKQSKQAN